MGHILTSIPFYMDTLVMSEIEEATHVETFNLNGQPISTFIGERPAKLEEFEGEGGRYRVTIVSDPNGRTKGNEDFVVFRSF